MYKMNYIILLVCMVLGVFIIFSGRVIHSPVFFIVGIVCIMTSFLYLYVSYPPAPQLYDFDTSGNNLYTPSTTHSYIDPSSGYVTIYFSTIPYAQSYTVTVWGQDIITSTGISSPIIVTGINQVGTYTCTVMATTPFGTSVSSKESHSFQIYPVYPPTITSVTFSGNLFTINFTEDQKTKPYPALTHVVTCTYSEQIVGQSTIYTKTQSIQKIFTESQLLFSLDNIQDNTEYNFSIVSKSVYTNSTLSNTKSYTTKSVIKYDTKQLHPYPANICIEGDKINDQNGRYKIMPTSINKDTFPDNVSTVKLTLLGYIFSDTINATLITNKGVLPNNQIYPINVSHIYTDFTSTTPISNTIICSNDTNTITIPYFFINYIVPLSNISTYKYSWVFKLTLYIGTSYSMTSQLFCLYDIINQGIYDYPSCTTRL